MIEKFWLNENIFYFLNSFGDKNIYLDNIFIFFGEWLIYIMIIFYILFFIKKIWSDKKIEIKELFVYFSAPFGSWIIVKIIKTFYPVERPFFALENVNQLLSEYHLSSFPSGHATLSFALAFSIFLYNKKIGSLFLFLAFCVSLSRIFTGVHFPLDIVVGAILGILISWSFFKKKGIIKNF